MGIYSSIVNEVIGTISSKFIFLRKDFECKKCKSNQKQLTKQKEAKKTKQKRQQVFACTKIAKRVKVVCFGFWCFFMLKIFLLKTSNTILPKYTPINHTHLCSSFFNKQPLTLIIFSLVQVPFYVLRRLL